MSRLWGGCRRIEAQIRPFLEQELAPGQAARVREHLARCPECKRRADAIRSILAAARSLPAPEMAPGFVERLHARLAVEPAPSLWQRLASWAGPGGRGFTLGLTAAAALILAALGLLLAPAPRITAQEVRVRVQASWSKLQDYHCTIHTVNRYSGGRLEVNREQWFRKPDQFRIESDDGARRVTTINGAEVLTYLPEAHVAILRPRREDEPDLPFPFRSTADLRGDITVDAFLERLQDTSDAELIGREQVLDKECYILKFRAVKPPTRRVRHDRTFDCRVWVDGDTFLPLKLKMYRNRHNWSYARATNLEVNQGLPAGLFQPNLPAGTHLVRGDVDRRIFEQEGDAVLRRDVDPRAAARRAQRRFAFRLLSPTWVPEGFRVIDAVSRHEPIGERFERRYTLTLLNDAGDAITIVQEPAAEEYGTEPEALLYADAGTVPYPHVRAQGIRAGTGVRVFAANVPRTAVIHLIRALRTEAELADVRRDA